MINKMKFFSLFIDTKYLSLMIIISIEKIHLTFNKISFFLIKLVFTTFGLNLRKECKIHLHNF